MINLSSFQDTAPGCGGRFAGCLLGLMAGDALGLPLEGLTPRRAARLFPGELRHRLLPGAGLCSDDTEHACMTAQALLAGGDSPEEFGRLLAWKLRLWLLGAPAGIGWATLRATLKLWLGVPPERSGVFSAGNGPAMRAPVLGVAFVHEPDRLAAFCRASTRLTHTDPKAERGALAAALAARYAARHGPGDFAREELQDELARLFPAEDHDGRAALAAGFAGEEAPAFVRRLGLERGVSGYIYHTLAAALWGWLAAPFDFAGGMRRALALGGDTDTVAAVYGGIAGAACGDGGIPAEWLAGIREFPRGVAWVRGLARRLHARFALGEDPGPQPLFWPALALRNPLFAALVLAHGLRRLAPPY